MDGDRIDGMAGKFACFAYPVTNGYVQDLGKSDYQEIPSDDGQG